MARQIFLEEGDTVYIRGPHKITEYTIMFGAANKLREWRCNTDE